MRVRGRTIAREILEETRAYIAPLERPVTVRALVMQPSAATESYLSIKARRAQDAGMMLEIVRIDEDATEADLITALRAPGADATIVQLPLPEGVATRPVLDAIPSDQDADVLSTDARTRFTDGAEGALLPPVVDAVREILIRTNTPITGCRAVVVGQGWLVGEPVATWLTREGAQVTAITEQSGDLSLLRDADLIVSGAGVPGLIHKEHLKPGVVLIDAGTSESGGAIVGDADPACEEVAAVFTPVPGGVGPIAVACLFRNAATLARMRS